MTELIVNQLMIVQHSQNFVGSITILNSASGQQPIITLLGHRSTLNFTLMLLPPMEREQLGALSVIQTAAITLMTAPSSRFFTISHFHAHLPSALNLCIGLSCLAPQVPFLTDWVHHQGRGKDLNTVSYLTNTMAPVHMVIAANIFTSAHSAPKSDTLLPPAHPRYSRSLTPTRCS